MKSGMDTSDIENLEKCIWRIGKLPQKCVNSAARQGARVLLLKAKQNAPYESGNLEKGMILVGERSKTKGKKGYQVTFARDMNDVFQKPIKNPGAYGGKSKSGYYPASMEYGFKLSGKRRREGEYFMQGAIESEEGAARNAVNKTLIEKLDNEFLKKVGMA